MLFLRTHRLLVAGVVLVLGAPTAWLLGGNPATDDRAVVATVRRGEFTVTVTTSGELRAREFVQITGPANAQQAGAYQMKIASIVPEGTVVKAGDIVAEIDRSTIATKLTDVQLALDKAQAQYEQAMLDSTLGLSTAREAIRTMELGLEEKRLAKEQAVYEAPTVRRQAEIDLEKAERALAQARTDTVFASPEYRIALSMRLSSASTIAVRSARTAGMSAGTSVSSFTSPSVNCRRNACVASAITAAGSRGSKE